MKLTDGLDPWIDHGVGESQILNALSHAVPKDCNVVKYVLKGSLDGQHGNHCSHVYLLRWDLSKKMGYFRFAFELTSTVDLKR
ncbi:hypothetical protein MUK42_32557 [Musa troglodytarum]|uniref:Uncharacterized protein n=1 Tax=Musa troglodytarum TaxID=320322 RepID=A0A9E7GKG2_9LILI|nr:hypothetical protein MUK42_32557 [Musa troglodytarum]